MVGLSPVRARKHRLRGNLGVVQPVTRYVSVDRARVAYQVFGAGPLTIVVSAGSFSNADVVWEDPGAAVFYTRLRVVRTGDPV